MGRAEAVAKEVHWSRVRRAGQFHSCTALAPTAFGSLSLGILDQPLKPNHQCHPLGRTRLLLCLHSNYSVYVHPIPSASLLSSTWSSLILSLYETRVPGAASLLKPRLDIARSNLCLGYPQVQSCRRPSPSCRVAPLPLRSTTRLEKTTISDNPSKDHHRL